LPTSRKYFRVNQLIKEGDLKGQKMASTHFGSNCPSKVNPYRTICTWSDQTGFG
jgi:hypothetical protein